MGDDEDVLACGQLAVPAVGHVEHPPSDDRRHVGVLAQHEVGRGLGAAGLVVGAREASGDVAVAEPVEQRPDAVAVVGHEPVLQEPRLRALYRQPPELTHVRTWRHPPQTNGVIER